MQKNQVGLEEKMRGSEFSFDNINVLHYNLHKISLNRGGSERNKLSITRKRLEKVLINNKSIALNILYVPHNTEEIRLKK